MKNIRFDERVAVVTGAGNGLGRYFALALAERGAAVVVNDLGTAPDGRDSSRAVAEIVVAEIEKAGGRAVASCDSVATREGGESIIQTALDHFGRVDIVISNAGFLRNNPFEKMPPDDIDAVLDTHLKGAFHVSQPAYRVMQKQGYGRLLFVSSGVGMFGLPYHANYGAAKGGMAGLSNVLAIEGARHGILSNALLPIGLSRGWANMGAEFEALPVTHDLSPLMDWLGPEFVAPLVLYLVSDRSTVTHGLYSAVAGRFARVFTGVTHGWYGPRKQPASPEEIAEHWDEVEDRTDYSMPLTHTDEIGPILATITGRTSD